MLLPNYFLFHSDFYWRTVILLLTPFNWVGLRDQRITALVSVAVRHIVFFANVYRLCVCLAYVCTSVFINTPFRKSLPPASSASLKRLTASGGQGVGADGGRRPESHTDSNALNNVKQSAFLLNFQKASNRFLSAMEKA